MRLAALALLISSAALAEDAKVTVNADVVFAELKAGAIEAGLSKMAAALAQGEHGKKYGTMKKLSSQTVPLETKPAVLPLPNGKTAQLSLKSLDKGVATVHVKVVDLGESTAKLGSDGSLYQQAGGFDGGDLWVVVSKPK